MQAQTKKLEPEISSGYLQSVKTNSLVEYPINICLRHTNMSSDVWAGLCSDKSYVSLGSDN